MSIPQELAASAAARSRKSHQKLEEGKLAVELSISRAEIKASDVTITMLLKTAGLGERFFAAKAELRADFDEWRKNLPNLEPAEKLSWEEKYKLSQNELNAALEQNTRMADRLHSFADRLRQANRLVRSLRENTEKTVVKLHP